MAKFSLVEFSIRRPKLIVAATVVLTLLFLTQFPRITTDTNPKHMLPETSDVRVWNDEVDKIFALYEDTIVVGVQNDAGVLNRETLGRIARITGEILKLQGVASRDVNGFTTITNVTAEAGTLKVGPLMPAAPPSEAEVESLRQALFGNPLFVNRIISPDGKTTAIYAPLEKGANGKAVADRVREITAKEKGDEAYHIAGDPVARDTFGSEMFKLMGVFSPIAGMIMFAAAYFMFNRIHQLAALNGGIDKRYINAKRGCEPTQLSPGMGRKSALEMMAFSTRSGAVARSWTVICAPSDRPTTHALPPEVWSRINSAVLSAASCMLKGLI